MSENKFQNSETFCKRLSLLKCEAKTPSGPTSQKKDLHDPVDDSRRASAGSLFKR